MRDPGIPSGHVGHHPDSPVNHQHPPRELVRLEHILRREEQVAQRVTHAHRLAWAQGATDRGEMFEPERGFVSDLLDDIGHGRKPGGGGQRQLVDHEIHIAEFVVWINCARSLTG
jgi:hypothetical protein